MKLGDWVFCSGYLKKTHASLTHLNGVAYLRHGGTLDNEEVDLDYWGQRYETIEKQFSGVFVGTTTVCTKLFAEIACDPYMGEDFRVSSDTPVKCAVIYFASNRKRLVPLDRVEEGATK